jgi:hypothetical protein
VTLTVTALGRNHQPVADLNCSEFQVLDNGKPQPITGCSPVKAQAPTVVIMWDLLNIVKGHRGYSNELLTRSIRSSKDAGSVYVYLLSNAGTLVPIHDLDGTVISQLAWPGQVKEALDAGLDKVVRLRPMDFQNEGIRTGTTFLRLADVEEQLKKVAGPKTMVWLSTAASNLMQTPYGCQDVVFPGVPDYVAGKCVAVCGKYGSGATCIDYAPFLRHFAAELQQSGTGLSIVEETPYAELARADAGSPRDTIEQLAQMAGARVFERGRIDLALNSAAQDSLGRFQISFTGAEDGKSHQLRVVSTRPGVTVEGAKRYFAGR